MPSAASARKSLRERGSGASARRLSRLDGAVAYQNGTADRKPFSYWDKGLLATIGRAKAVARIGKLHFGGFFAWLFGGTTAL